MLEPMHIFDEIATTKILADEMHSLYLFSFLLTADNDIAEHCYVRGLGNAWRESAFSWIGRVRWRAA